MLDKIKNTIKTNIWGWSFLILFGIVALVKLSINPLILGVLVFFYGKSIQKQVTWKDAVIVGAKVFSFLFAIPLLLQIILLHHWKWKIFIALGISIAISTLVFTAIACLLNFMIKQKGQVEDKKAEQKLVVNKDECEFSPKLWNRSAFITFLFVAGLAFILEIIFLKATHKSSFSFSITGASLLWGPLLVGDLICLIFSGCFSSWSEKINQPSLWYKALILGGKSSLIIYGSMLIFWGLSFWLLAVYFVPFILFRIIAFTFIYAFLVCGMAEKFKVKAPKNKKKKSV